MLLCYSKEPIEPEEPELVEAAARPAKTIRWNSIGQKLGFKL